MAWNGSDQSGRATSMKSPDSRPRRAVASSRRPYQRGILAGILVVVLLGAMLWWIGRTPESPHQPSAAKPKSQIATVTPAPARTNAASRVAKPTPEKPKPYSKYVDYDPDRVYTDKAGVLRYKKGNGRVRLSDEEMAKHLVYHEKQESGLPEFKYACESEIATLLTLKPGEMIFGDIEHGRAWKQDFIKALMEPVEINEDDTEKFKQIKVDVEATKKELAQRLKEGEDVGQILEDTRNELRRLAAYRSDMIALAKSQVSETAVTVRDVEDIHTAINKMLESKGIAPIEMNAIIRRKLYRELSQGKTKTESEGKQK